MAFERIRIQKGFDKPGSEDQSELKDLAFPTVWNQLEAAMAYANDLPILTVVQRGIKRQGILSDRSEWYVQEVELNPDSLQSPEFKGVFDDWKHLVAKHAEGKVTSTTKGGSEDISKLSIHKLIGMLKPAQFWAVLVAIAALLAAVATIAYKLGITVGKTP